MNHHQITIHNNNGKCRLYQPKKPSPPPPSASCPAKKDKNKYLRDLKNMAMVSDEFMTSRGYETSQRNGQRVSVLKDYQLPNDDLCREIFIGKLPRDMFELELLPIMERIGPVFKMRIMMDFSGSTRGFAFVVFKDPNHVNVACEKLNNVCLRPDTDARIGIQPSYDNKKLWMGNLPLSLTAEVLISELDKIVNGVEKVELSSCIKQGSRYALVKFRTHDDATRARRVLCPGSVKIMGQKIKVDWAKPEVPKISPSNASDSMCPSIVPNNMCPSIASNNMYSPFTPSNMGPSSISSTIMSPSINLSTMSPSSISTSSTIARPDNQDLNNNLFGMDKLFNCTSDFNLNNDLNTNFFKSTAITNDNISLINYNNNLAPDNLFGINSTNCTEPSLVTAGTKSTPEQIERYLSAMEFLNSKYIRGI